MGEYVLVHTGHGLQQKLRDYGREERERRMNDETPHRCVYVLVHGGHLVLRTSDRISTFRSDVLCQLDVDGT